MIITRGYRINTRMYKYAIYINICVYYTGILSVLLCLYIIIYYILSTQNKELILYSEVVIY